MPARNTVPLHALALAAIVCAAPPVAQAGTVVLTAHEALGSATGPGTDVMDPLMVNGGDFFRNGSGAGSTSFFHTYGFSGGPSASYYFGARASGTGTFFVKTSATFTDSWLNSSGSAQLVNFGFHVDQGEIGIFGTGTGYADLELSLSLFINNVLVGTGPVEREHGRIDKTAGGTTCVVNDQDAGSQLAGYLSCSGSGASASGGGGSYSVSQLLNDGDTLKVVYSIVAETAGTLDASTATTECIGGLEGRGAQTLTRPGDAGLVEQGGYFTCVDLNGVARSGDPAGFGTFAPASPGFSVPEPGSLALVGLALAGLALRRRRG